MRCGSQLLGVVGLLVLMHVVLRPSQAREAEPQTVLLWPQGAPGAHGDAEGDKPTLTVWLPAPEKAVPTAIIICPGGGYGMLAMDHEGRTVARWLNDLGVAAFILKYRHAGVGYHHPAPLQDVQRAIRTVRGRAAEWKIKPERIGVLGFSAGGHLASTAGTHFDDGRDDATDAIERVSCRPDFMVLVYPVITMSEPYMHRGSRNNLLGSQPAADLAEQFSNDKQVTPRTPPTFLIHTDQDPSVPVENSLAFYAALRRAKVPAELHVFEKGPHGFGLGKPGDAASAWPALCGEWLKTRGLLDRSR